MPRTMFSRIFLPSGRSRPLQVAADCTSGTDRRPLHAANPLPSDVAPAPTCGSGDERQGSTHTVRAFMPRWLGGRGVWSSGCSAGAAGWGFVAKASWSERLAIASGSVQHGRLAGVATGPFVEARNLVHGLPSWFVLLNSLPCRASRFVHRQRLVHELGLGHLGILGDGEQVENGRVYTRGPRSSRTPDGCGSSTLDPGCGGDHAVSDPGLVRCGTGSSSWRRSRRRDRDVLPRLWRSSGPGEPAPREPDTA